VEPLIKKIFGSSVEIIDPARVTINALKADIKNGIISVDNQEAKKEFWVTDFPSKFAKMGRIFLGHDIKVKTITFQDYKND
jgi:glutamate racemase